MVLDIPSTISIIKRREGTICPVCEGMQDVRLISLQSDYLSTTFALCKTCRIALVHGLKDTI
jgi:hypothetical protein